MHMRRGLARAAVGLVALAGVGGAAYAGTDQHAAKVAKVAIATPAKDNDYGWNQQGVKAAKAAAAANGATLQAVTGIGYDKTDTVLRQLAKGGANLIIAHASGYDPITQRLAEQLKVPMISYDIPTALKKNYLSNITTSSEQGAYLAGILAAKVTKTKKVGIVISASDANWYKMSGGFAAGVRSVSKDTKIVFATVSPTGYDDSAGGKRVATSVIGSGADVIFGMGDGASFGYLQAIETAKSPNKVWYIGDIGDMTPIDKKHVLLSSVLWDFTGAYKSAIQDVNKGTFGVKGYNLDLKNGGVSLLKTKYIPAAVWSQIKTAQAGIVSGKIKVPSASKKAEVDKLIK